MERLWFQRFADRLLQRMSVQRRRGSVVLADIEAASGDQRGLDQLDAVLDILRIADERRYTRIMRQLRAIHLVTLEVYAGQYRHGSRTCQLDRGLLLRRPELQTAATIVHEATHGRLKDRGIGYGPGIRSRVERACEREQVRFLERAGADREVVAQYKAGMGRAAPTDLELAEDGVQILMAHGIPRWVAKVLTAYERWSLRRHPQIVRPAEEQAGRKHRQVP